MPATYLDDFSQIIHMQAETRRKAQNRAIKSMKRALPKQKKLMDDMEDEDLLNHVIYYSQQGRADPREVELFQELADYGKKLVLKRMK